MPAKLTTGGAFMQPDLTVVGYIDGRRYTVKDATLIASNAFWDGSNWERQGRNTFLFKTKNGNYFYQFRTCWEKERDCLQPLTVDQALEWWENLTEREMTFEEAFPGVKIEEA